MKKNIFCLAALCVAAAAFAQDSFFDESGPADNLEFSGSVSSVTDVTLDRDNMDDATANYYDAANIGMKYLSDKVDIILSLDIEDSGLTENSWSANVAFDEAYGRYYFGLGDFELGLMKPVWGAGDGVHVIDILTPMNYSRFIEPDYADRKEPMPMAKLNLDFQAKGRLELVYIPYYEPDVYPLSGPWAQGRALALAASARSALEAWSNLLYGAYFTAASMNPSTAAVAQGLAAMQTMQTVSDAQDSLMREDNTYSPEYSQGAVRYRMSLTSVDFSVLAGTVFMSEPVVKAVDIAEIATALNPTVLDPHYELSYERAYVGGFDFSGEVFGSGYRGEFAARITKDLEGDDPSVPNPRIGWVFGIDRNINFKDLYVNLQTQGEVILLDGEIASPLDTDYRTDYTRNVIAAQVEAKPINEYFTCAVSGAYVVEDSSYRVQPSLTYVLGDVFELKAAYSLYEGDSDSMFGQFDANDYLSFTGTLSF